MSLKRLNIEKNPGYLFFRNPPLLQISTFSLGQKVCAYYEKSAYNECAYYEKSACNECAYYEKSADYECAYYERAQYLAHSGIIIKEERKFCYVEF